MEVQPHFKGKVRIRACGLLREGNKLLLLRLKSPITKQQVWIPPGGGVEFGETLEEALIREFLEETGLVVQVHELRHINEIIHDSIHAIEFYFDVIQLDGKLKLGIDPEYDEDNQLIEEVRFFSREEIQKINTAPTFIVKAYWDNEKLDLTRNR